jgi:triacylglycerol esterase/lipase EstA (alpha/beta hydrolase family)
MNRIIAHCSHHENTLIGTISIDEPDKLKGKDVIVVYMILGAAVFVAAASYGLLWYEIADRQHHDRLRNTAGGNLGLFFIKSIVWATLTQLFVYLTYFAHRIPSLLDTKDDGEGPVIIFVHGLYHNASAWLLFRHWFKQAGLNNTHCLTYGSMLRTYDETVPVIKFEIEQLARKFPDRPLVLVGHSLGGLYIRSCMNDYTFKGRVSAVITLGTPHRGSKLAAFGIGRTALNLRYKSPFMRRLNKQACTCRVPSLAIYSPFDNMVMPPKGLKPPQNSGWTEQVTKPINHIRLLYDKDTANYAVAFIKSALRERTHECGVR